MPFPSVHIEQAVYGSFPFWDRGYAILAQSPGCRPEWLADLRVVCQKFGEPPRGASADGALFALRLPSGPWAVVGVSDQGDDDQGRPGALAFHALFLSPRDYRKAGASPFVLAPALRQEWFADIRSLPALTRGVDPTDAPLSPAGSGSGPSPGRLDSLPPGGGGPGWGGADGLRIASALARGHRVVVESATPINGLAREVWHALPEPVRRRASVATLAFRSANGFDLVAFPRIDGASLDASYLGVDALDADVSEPSRIETPGWRTLWLGPGAAASTRSRRLMRLLGMTAVLVFCFSVVGTVLALRAADGPARNSPAPATRTPPQVPTIIASAPSHPDPSLYRDERIDPNEVRRVVEALIDLAERFDGTKFAPSTVTDDADPTALMVLLADRLRYHGPFLSDAELDRLRIEPHPDRARVLAWHKHLRHFALDRPLPAHFAHGPLRWRLDTLAWSFHLEPDPRLAPAEVPHALADALAVDISLRSTTLADRYPALVEYVRFLERLPRR